MMKDIFGNDLIERFNLNRRFVGYVIDNSEWEEDNSVRVFIKEMFPVYNTVPVLYNSTEAINNVNINNNSMRGITSINTSTGLKARCCRINHFNIKPNIGEHVIVEFIDGDIKKPIYYIMSYSNDFSIRHKGIDIKITNDKINIEVGKNKFSIDNDCINLEGKIIMNGVDISNVPDMEE